MNKENSSRKLNVTKGVLSSLILNFIKIIIQFVFRSIFIRFLGVEFLGVNSAITGVLNFLSVTELGIGSAITFNLYKPVLEGDTQKINSIISLFKRFYIYIGCIIAVLGLGLTPFLKFIIADVGNLNTNIYIVYILTLASTVFSYFFSYRNVLFTAFQHQYKSNAINIIITIFTTLTHILSIIIFKNYYAYIVAQVICSIVSTLLTYFYTKKIYAEINLKNVKPLDDGTKQNIRNNIKGMFYHKISYSILQATDSLVISSFIGATLLGIYSNYTIFTTSIISIISMILVSLAGSVGNLIAEDDPERTYSIYKILKMLFFWLAGFCSISLLVLLNPTIELWAKLGKWSTEQVWTLDIETIIIIVLNFYIYASRCITGSFREGIGNFYKDRFKGLAEAIINVVVSVLLVKPLGIAGVLIGTIVSCVCTSFWVDPYMLYKYHFKKPLFKHFLDVAFYTIIIAFAGLVTWIVCDFLTVSGVVGLLIKILLCVLVPNVIILACLIPTKEFKVVLAMAREVLTKKIVKKNNEIDVKAVGKDDSYESIEVVDNGKSLEIVDLGDDKTPE